MAYRDPAVVNVSYFFVHVADPAIRDAPRRAATLLKAMLPFRALVETCVKPFFLYNHLCAHHLAIVCFSAQLEHEKIRETPLCMDSYKWLSAYSYVCRAVDLVIIIFLVQSPCHSISRYPIRHRPHIRSCNTQPRRLHPNNWFFEVRLAHPDGTELSMVDLETYELTFDYLLYA